jgi:hypothetical protein
MLPYRLAEKQLMPLNILIVSNIRLKNDQSMIFYHSGQNINRTLKKESLTSPNLFIFVL